MPRQREAGGAMRGSRVWRHVAPHTASGYFAASAFFDGSSAAFT